VRRRFDLAVLLLPLLTPASGQAACTVSASGVAFGVYNPSSVSPTDAVGTVTLSCSPMSGPGNYEIGLSIGGGGSYARRAMGSGRFTLPYQLYSNAWHGQIWGDGTGGSSVVIGTDNIPARGGTSTYRVYGRIPARLRVSPGTYTDLIVVTVTF
jgi:spore coat protein U-like protein